jgi:hypothetical protein
MVLGPFEPRLRADQMAIQTSASNLRADGEAAVQHAAVVQNE